MAASVLRDLWFCVSCRRMGIQPMDESYNEVARNFILEMVQSDNSEETMKLIAKWLSNHFTQSK